MDLALGVLQRVENLATTKNQETLGLTGAIFKRKWEVDNQRQHLERALHYYLRGAAVGAVTDQGYNGINAAFILDQLASLEEHEGEEAGKPRRRPDRAATRPARSGATS